MTSSSRSLFGRLLVLIPFWGIAMWVIAAVVGGVAWGLYAPSPSAEQSGVSTHRQRNWCTSRLSGLRDELEAAVLYELQRPFTTPLRASRWPAFVRDFEPAVEQANQSCSSEVDPLLPPAYVELTGLYRTYADAVQSLTTHHDESGSRIDAALRQLKTRP